MRRSGRWHEFRAVAAALAVMTSGCFGTSEDRASADLTVGQVTASGVSFEVEAGLAAIRKVSDGALELWSQSPQVTLRATAATNATEAWTLTVRNLPADSVLHSPGGALTRPTQVVGTQATWTVRPELGRTSAFVIGPTDSNTARPLRFAVLGDVQAAVGKVQDIYDRINAVSDLSFVVSPGDLTESAKSSEFRTFEGALAGLNVPLYATCGNHDVGGDWTTVFGRHSFSFHFRGTTFLFLDSAAAAIDPMVWNWLDGWLEDAHQARVLVTHYPTRDPAPLRGGSFRSRAEAAKLIAAMARAGVDLALHGHIHSHYAFSAGGVTSHITGGGGADPERFDGIGRHFLVVDVDPTADQYRVEVVRVAGD